MFFVKYVLMHYVMIMLRLANNKTSGNVRCRILFSRFSVSRCSIDSSYEFFSLKFSVPMARTSFMVASSSAWLSSYFCFHSDSTCSSNKQHRQWLLQKHRPRLMDLQNIKLSSIKYNLYYLHPTVHSA